MLVNLVSPPVPSLNILSVIILVQIINLSRRGCNKELLLKPGPLPFSLSLLFGYDDQYLTLRRRRRRQSHRYSLCCILTRQENHYYFDV